MKRAAISFWIFHLDHICENQWDNWEIIKEENLKQNRNSGKRNFKLIKKLMIVSRYYCNYAKKKEENPATDTIANEKSFSSFFLS